MIDTGLTKHNMATNHFTKNNTPLSLSHSISTTFWQRCWSVWKQNKVSGSLQLSAQPQKWLDYLKKSYLFWRDSECPDCVRSQVTHTPHSILNSPHQVRPLWVYCCSTLKLWAFIFSDKQAFDCWLRSVISTSLLKCTNGKKPVSMTCLIRIKMNSLLLICMHLTMSFELPCNYAEVHLKV